MRNLIRQGDVLLLPVNTIPSATTPVPRDNGRVVLAYGEVTGHAHALIDPDVTLVEASGTRYVSTNRLTHLLHEEHTMAPTKPGAYEVRIQKEYTPEAIRDVAD